MQIHRQMELDGKHITAREIKELLRGNGAHPKMLLEEFRKHNEQCRNLIGTEYSPATVLRYERVARYLEEYMQAQYRAEDIPLREINHEFVTNFEYYLKTEKECGHNAVVKQLKCLKKLTRLAIMNDWISKDPFLNVKLREKCTERDFLEADEINLLIKKELPVVRSDVCPIMWLTDSIGTPRNSVCCVAKVWRAIWKVRFTAMPHRLAMVFRWAFIVLRHGMGSNLSPRIIPS